MAEGDLNSTVSCSGCLGSFFGIHPLTFFADQGNQLFDGIQATDVSFDAVPTPVEVDASGTRTDVAEIGVSHFSRTVDNAAHHRDFHTL